MTIEQKAKAYDEALERTKKWYNAPNVDKIPTFGNRVIEEIFPELKESKDERIRKDIIVLIKDWWDRVNKDNISTKEQMLAWLEKQDEQKPLPPIDDNYALKASEEYRKDRESCGIKDPIMLDEIETAYFAGATLKQNPAWSEEDEAHINGIIDYLLDYKLLVYKEDMNVANGVQKELDWLETLKQRIGE